MWRQRQGRRAAVASRNTALHWLTPKRLYERGFSQADGVQRLDVSDLDFMNNMVGDGRYDQRGAGVEAHGGRNLVRAPSRGVRQAVTRGRAPVAWNAGAPGLRTSLATFMGPRFRQGPGRGFQRRRVMSTGLFVPVRSAEHQDCPEWTLRVVVDGEMSRVPL